MPYHSFGAVPYWNSPLTAIKKGITADYSHSIVAGGLEVMS